MEITSRNRKFQELEQLTFYRTENPHTLQQSKQAVQVQNHNMKPNVKFP